MTTDDVSNIWWLEGSKWEGIAAPVGGVKAGLTEPLWVATVPSRPVAPLQLYLSTANRRTSQ